MIDVFLQRSAIKSERPKTSRGLPEKKQASTSSFQANSALSRFSQLEKEILSRKNTSAVNYYVQVYIASLFFLFSAKEHVITF